MHVISEQPKAYLHTKKIVPHLPCSGESVGDRGDFGEAIAVPDDTDRASREGTRFSIPPDIFAGFIFKL